MARSAAWDLPIYEIQRSAEPIHASPISLSVAGNSERPRERAEGAPRLSTGWRRTITQQRYSGGRGGSIHGEVSSRPAERRERARARASIPFVHDSSELKRAASPVTRESPAAAERRAARAEPGRGRPKAGEVRRGVRGRDLSRR